MGDNNFNMKETLHKTKETVSKLLTGTVEEVEVDLGRKLSYEGKIYTLEEFSKAFFSGDVEMSLNVLEDLMKEPEGEAAWIEEEVFLKFYGVVYTMDEVAKSFCEGRVETA